MLSSQFSQVANPQTLLSNFACSHAAPWTGLVSKGCVFQWSFSSQTTGGAAGNIIFSHRKPSLARETASGCVNFFLILQAWELSQVWSSWAGLDWAICLSTFWTYPAWENLCSAVASHPHQQPRLLGSNLSLPKQAMETRGWPEGLCNKFSLPYQHVANNPIVSVHQYAPGWREAEMRFAFWCKCPAQALQRVAVSCSCSILIRSTGIPQGFGFFLLGLFFFSYTYLF